METNIKQIEEIKSEEFKLRRKEKREEKRYFGTLKIIPLGGLEEVGRNLTAFELNEKEILIVDIGLGYPFFEEMPGVDFLIPNVEYLEKNKEKIVGIVITHGHYDHIGAIPYLIDKLGNPPIYATPLSKGIILKRQEDFPSAPKLEVIEFRKDVYKPLKIGSFTIDYFHVNHNIPDSVGLFIQTPVGNIMHTGDFKIDFTPFFDKPADLSRIVKLSLRGVRLLMIDSTNSYQPGFVISERKIMETLEEIFRKANGRIIAVTFASLLERIQQLIYLSAIYGRKVVVDGHTMRMNVEVARNLRYLQMPKGTIIKPEESFKLKPHQVTIICTGSQAEEGSALMRIVNGEHRYFKLIKDDTVIFSSSIIPGNERIVQELKDDILKQGAKVVHYQMMDIHASGHAFSEEVKLFISLVKPEYVMPVHGHYFMLKAVEEIAINLGIPQEKIIIAQNGDVIKMLPEKIFKTDERVPAHTVYVDGLGMGSVESVVLRDRKNLAKEGMFVIIVTIDSQTGEIRKNPEIIFKGFGYSKESNKELIQELSQLIKKIVKRNIKFLGEEAPLIQEEQIKYHLREEIADFLYHKTGGRPMILPVVIKI
ncbi:MAG: ribonuclease J [Candidatus Pacebacteria bacterium]|nr:ribonuclease J [Candidatus Paceibacterota bacterium]